MAQQIRIRKRRKIALQLQDKITEGQEQTITELLQYVECRQSRSGRGQARSRQDHQGVQGLANDYIGSQSAH